MDNKINTGDKSAGQEDTHKTFDWQHVWKSVEHTASQAGNAIKEKAAQIDTRELADKAKHAAGEGLKVARGKSDNKQANEISNAAAQYVPGAGLIRKGAEIAHETGADGKVLEGKKGPLRAPSERTMREASKEAIGTAIPIPGGGLIMNEVLNKSGVKDKVVDGAFDAAKKHGLKTGTAERQSTLPLVVIEDRQQNNLLGTAKDKVTGLFHKLHKPDEAEAKKK